MGRELRPLAAGAYYHVTTRGNNQAPIVLDDADRHTFIRILTRVVGRYGWKLHASCLMGNHYHLVVETPRPNLSDGMRDLNGQYARAFNYRPPPRSRLRPAVLVEADRVRGPVRSDTRVRRPQPGPSRLRRPFGTVALDLGARHQSDTFA